VHLCDEEYWDGLFSQNPPLSLCQPDHALAIMRV
jgi:predicted acylesterase/phospholipase RssA